MGGTVHYICLSDELDEWMAKETRRRACRLRGDVLTQLLRTYQPQPLTSQTIITLLDMQRARRQSFYKPHFRIGEAEAVKLSALMGYFPPHLRPRDRSVMAALVVLDARSRSID